MKTEPQVPDPILGVGEFWELPEEEGQRLELSRGRVVREPAPGPRHGRVAFVILDRLRRAGEEKGLGLVFFDTGFALPALPDTVRVPDVAFVASHRIPEEGITDRFWELAPDLVVEVLCRSNRASHMQRKALEYLEAGAGLVWIVDPAEQTVAAGGPVLHVVTLGEPEPAAPGPFRPVLGRLNGRFGPLTIGEHRRPSIARWEPSVPSATRCSGSSRTRKPFPWGGWRRAVG